MKEMPIIDPEKCQQCGLCVGVCGCGALQKTQEGVRVVWMDDCQWCTLCELACPHEAITCPFEVVFENDEPGA